MTAFTRKELYKQVWNTPMRRLAAEYGLSDVGLAKICKKHDIPKPTRGYWAQVKAGRKPTKIPLPSQQSEAKIMIRTHSLTASQQLTNKIEAEQEKPASCNP
jgi:hypothetical protein